MKIKNIIINEIDTFVNLVIDELIKNNISYLYIKDTNEIHFDKYIFRFFDRKEIIKEIDKLIQILNNPIHNIFEELINDNSNQNFELELNKFNKKNLKPNYKNTTNKALKKQPFKNVRGYYRR